MRGAYHFGRPDLGNSPESEADWFWSVVGGSLEPGDLIALDLESGSGSLAGWTARFLARLKERAGFNPLLYASPNFLATRGINFRNVGGDYGLWEADWVATEPAPAAGWPVLAIWQNGSAGTLAGIAGRVDGDVFNGDRATLLKYGKPGAYGASSGSVTPPAPTPAPKPAPTPAPAPVPSSPAASSPVGQDELPTPPKAPNGGSMASSDPTPVVTTPDVPEPGVVAEAGVSTSEWKLALGYLAQAFALGTADAANAVSEAVFHQSVSIPAPLLQALVNVEFAAAFVVASYVISRGVRKLGTK